MIKRFLKGSQFYIYSAYLPVVISIFTLPLVTPYLTLRDYGIYGLVFSIYTFLVLILNLGFSVEFQNLFFNKPGRYQQEWSRTLGFQLCWNLVTVLPLAAIVTAIVAGELSKKEVLVVLFSLLGPYVLLDPFRGLGSRLLQYTEKHKLLFLITVVGTLFQYAAVVFLILFYRVGFIAWFIGNACNSLFGGLVLYWYLRKHGIYVQLNFSIRSLADRLKKQAAIIFHNLSGYILEASDRVLLAMFKVPINDIGSYNLAYNYTNYGQTVNGALNTVFSPMYFKAIRDADGHLKYHEIVRLFRFWVGLLVFLIVNMIIWADYIFSFLYRNEQLSSVYVYAFPMIVALIYRPFYVMVVDNLIIQEKTKKVLLISMSSSVLNIVLNLIFIPFFGIVAAVYSTAFTYLFMGFLGLIVPHLRNQLTFVYFRGYLIILLFAVIAVLTVHLLDFSALHMKLISLAVTTAILLYSFRNELFALRNSVNSKIATKWYQ
jgi:O-antigen/teichoic acid export membrane protein